MSGVATPFDVLSPIGLPWSRSKTQTDTWKKGDTLPRLEFMWDRVVIFFMLIAAAVSVADNVERLVLSSSVECFAPNITSRDQAAYINSFCYAYLSTKTYIPFYLPYFVAIANALVLTVHYLWVVWCERRFCSFFGNVAKLELYRNPTVGTYKPETMQVFETMRIAAKERKVIISYWVKIILQILVLTSSCIGFSIAIGEVYGSDELRRIQPRTHAFDCPDRNFTNPSEHWVLPTQVNCVYTSRELLTSPITTLINVMLFGLGALVAAYGAFYILALPHRHKLMAKEVAEFVFESPFLPEYFDNCYKERYHWWQPMVCCFQKSKYSCTCSVKNDFDMLLLILFWSNNSVGKLVHDIHIQSELDKYLRKQIAELLPPTRPRHSPSTFDLQHKLYTKVTRLCNPFISQRNKLVLVYITFGSVSCAYMLYSAFKRDRKDIRLVIVNFDPHRESNHTDLRVSAEPNKHNIIKVIHAAEHIYFSFCTQDIMSFEKAVTDAVSDLEGGTSRAHDHENILRVYFLCLPPDENAAQNYTIQKIFTHIDCKQSSAGQTIFLSFSGSSRDINPRCITPYECYGIQKQIRPEEERFTAKCGSFKCSFRLVRYEPWQNTLPGTDHPSSS